MSAGRFPARTRIWAETERVEQWAVVKSRARALDPMEPMTDAGSGPLSAQQGGSRVHVDDVVVDAAGVTRAVEPAYFVESWSDAVAHAASVSSNVAPGVPHCDLVFDRCSVAP